MGRSWWNATRRTWTRYDWLRNDCSPMSSPALCIFQFSISPSVTYPMRYLFAPSLNWDPQPFWNIGTVAYGPQWTHADGRACDDYRKFAHYVYGWGVFVVANKRNNAPLYLYTFSTRCISRGILWRLLALLILRYRCCSDGGQLFAYTRRAHLFDLYIHNSLITPSGKFIQYAVEHTFWHLLCARSS